MWNTGNKLLSVNTASDTEDKQNDTPFGDDPKSLVFSPMEQFLLAALAARRNPIVECYNRKQDRYS